MRDKAVRRRRAVLALLVVLSLILLTLYFGEGSSGGLHSIQRGFMAIVSPIEDVANKALKPVRSFFGDVGNVFHGSEERDKLRREVAKLRQELDRHEVDERSYAALSKLYKLDKQLNINDFKPVSAAILLEQNNVWSPTVVIDEGTSSGIQVEDAVINDEGLVGKVTQVGSDAAQVSLLSDSTVGVSAKIAGNGAEGIVQPKDGEPSTLVMRYLLPVNAQVTVGEQVITAGTIAGAGESLYPPGIPIGRVTAIDEESTYETVEVEPAVNFHALEEVQVLTDVSGRAATLARVAGTLMPGHDSGTTFGTQLASTGGG